MARKKSTCFVVMPFGIKRVGRAEVDFNIVFDQFIKPAGIAAGFRVERADTQEAAGSITGEFLKSLYRSDVVVADITYPNPNVFYELGVRHALSRVGTVLVRLVGGDLAIAKKGFVRRQVVEPLDVPFDIRDVTILNITLSAGTLERCRLDLKERLLLASSQSRTDSPVFHHIRGLRVEKHPAPAAGRQDRTFEIAGASGRFIGYRSGDICNLKGAEKIDFWVNSENTQMLMARTVERSISSTIRHHGAYDPDPKSPTFDDTIAVSLAAAMGNKHIVDEGAVLVTTSGRLRETHGVKAVFHAATVTGVPGRGFESISDPRLSECIARILDVAREQACGPDDDQRGRTIAIPLLGSGQARRDPTQIASLLISSAIDKLTEFGPNPDHNDIHLAVFSAYTQDDVDLFRRIFDELEREGLIRSVARSAIAHLSE